MRDWSSRVRAKNDMGTISAMRISRKAAVRVAPYNRAVCPASMRLNRAKPGYPTKPTVAKAPCRPGLGCSFGLAGTQNPFTNHCAHAIAAFSLGASVTRRLPAGAGLSSVWAG